MDFQKCLEILNSRPATTTNGSLSNRDTDTTDTMISSDAMTMNTTVSIEQQSCSLFSGWTTNNDIHTVPGLESIVGMSAITLDELQSLESIALVYKFRSLQEMRINTYHYFNNALDGIIQYNIPDRYPPMCADVTKRFVSISMQINCIRDILQDRQLTEFSHNITLIQGHEKDKLMYVAAQHLDQLQDAVSELSSITGGKTNNQVVYLRNKIKETEVLISDCLEDIMCSLTDLIEGA